MVASCVCGVAAFPLLFGQTEPRIGQPPSALCPMDSWCLWNFCLQAQHDRRSGEAEWAAGAGRWAFLECGRDGGQREAHKEGFDLKPRQALACVTPSVACVPASPESNGLRAVTL